MAKIQALNGVYPSNLKFSFAFQANGKAGNPGDHSSVLGVRNLTLTITYIRPIATGELNLNTVDIGQTIRIQNIERQDPDHTTKAVWKLKGQGAQAQDIGKAAYKDFTPPTSWYSILPNAVEGEATCELQTYDGTTLLGSKTYTFKAKVPASVKPTITNQAATPVSASTPAVPAGWNKYVKGKSKARISADIAPGTGSTIKSVSVSGAGFTGSALPFTSGLLSSIGTFDFTITVTDNRNRTHSVTVPVSVVDYKAPSASNVSFSRAASNGGAPDPNGTYIRGIATISAPMPEGVSNPITAKSYYRQVGASTWLPFGGVTVTSEAPFWMGDGGISLEHPYEVKLELTDALSTVPITAVIGTAICLFDFRQDRAALGRYATNALEFALPDNWNMQELVSITSTAKLEPGMAVYKAHEPGASGYDLPGTYKTHPDQRDYYHVGVVISVSPLRIMHCTSWSGGSGIKIDTTIGAWKWGGRLKKVAYDGQGGGETVDTLWVGRVTGGRLALRAAADKTSAVLIWMPDGAQVKVLDKATPDGWVYAEYNGQRGYCMRQYLQNVEDDPDGSSRAGGDKVTITLSRTAAKELL